LNLKNDQQRVISEASIHFSTFITRTIQQLRVLCALKATLHTEENGY
jgi:hypothetical protein